ncbi:hypothetical protein Aph02nite_44240 [Actinoplanes philippinensis]|uniref:Uncharacterized protein n=1 Tax=Actinoplanes philippinensis TaxID=35752 RepID=A0A1I2IAX7_9ACTN|nr:hypothetical protein [Actinoplanes philippinensis]GIE78474.1 hypothetical protein Aph02nite_44240 [Actinoplanes philippinensis]SFF38803.1 hypothetical protein SAMN05421541_109453 [Actinoplanes philippinensis]
MGTDIYGVIEVRDLKRAAALGADSHHDVSWVHCMNLYPLYPGGDYQPLGCLFGIRNWNGWEPVAEGRGLPPDVSEAVRNEYEHDARIDDAIGGSTWVSWPELRDLDMTVTPRARGVLEINENRYYRVEDEWPSDVVAEYGIPVVGTSPATAAYGRWQHGAINLTYKRVTRNDVLGAGTGWDHVFAVMRSLAERFGEEGVRLVAWFD